MCSQSAVSCCVSHNLLLLLLLLLACYTQSVAVSYSSPCRPVLTPFAVHGTGVSVKILAFIPVYLMSFISMLYQYGFPAVTMC